MGHENYQNGNSNNNNNGPHAPEPGPGPSPSANNGQVMTMQSQQVCAYPQHQFYGADINAMNTMGAVQQQQPQQQQQQPHQQQQLMSMQNNGSAFFGMPMDASSAAAAAAMGFDPMLRQQFMAQAQARAVAHAQQQQQQQVQGQQQAQQQGIYAAYPGQTFVNPAGQSYQMNSAANSAESSQQQQQSQQQPQQQAQFQQSNNNNGNNGNAVQQHHHYPQLQGQEQGQMQPQSQTGQQQQHQRQGDITNNNSDVKKCSEELSNIGGVPVPAMAIGTPTALHVEAAANAAAAAAAPPAKKPRGQQKQTKATAANRSTNTTPKEGKTTTTKQTKTKKEPTTRRNASKRKNPPETTLSSSETAGMSSTAAALIQNVMAENSNYNPPPLPSSSNNNNDDNNDSSKEMTEQERSQANRDRNREHARCTRLRKKAYVNKLKELVDGLHAERSEDARKRRVAVQHLAEMQELRRKVVHTFLGYHAKFENDENKWKRILEEDFWLKQPVTPYRSFRRCEIQKGSRVLKGISAMIGDAASMSVMIETIGSRNVRWLHRKRDEFLTRHASKYGRSGKGRAVGRLMPHSIVRQNSRLQHAVSSLSSSSGSSTGNGSGSEEERQLAERRQQQTKEHHHANSAPTNMGTTFDNQTSSAGQTSEGAKKVSSSSSSNDTRPKVLALPSSNDYHDYHAPSLPDPLLESGGSSPGSDSPRGDSDNCVVLGKHACTDSSSGEEDKTLTDHNPQKKQKADADASNKELERAAMASGMASSSQPGSSGFQGIPSNQLARSGGILHNVKPVAMATANVAVQPNGHARLSRAPVTALPPFVGLGKSSSATAATAGNNSFVHQKSSSNDNNTANTQSNLSNDETKQPSASASSKPISVVVPNPLRNKNKGIIPQAGPESYSSSTPRGNIITIDNDTTTSSQSSTQNQRGIQAYYHINEDDMILTDDVLMCPFIFRSQEAVWCGALAECVMPGMLRACYSPTNKLRNVEMIFDAMGFCQQLERASGNEGMAQIIPNSLEMALSPNKDEARVITLAKAPFPIVSVNEAWTRVTGYTQLDCEGKDLSILNGERTDLSAGNRPGMPVHDYESVADGRCACSVNIHYDSSGREFLDFMCSYPLTNLSDEVTHILHVCQELPGLPEHENI